MATYTSGKYTFTEEELQGGVNPYIEPDGDVKKGCLGQFMAFNRAHFAYRCDKATPEERAELQRRADHWQRKMQSSV